MMALLLLLVAVLTPLRSEASWINASLLTLLVLLAVPAVVTKVREPYEWQNYRSSPMFAGRQWYRHPVYGPMYMERDQLQFILPVCAEITAGNSKPELLSLPFPYPNYFCAAPPWHGYVQTFFDTSTRASGGGADSGAADASSAVDRLSATTEVFGVARGPVQPRAAAGAARPGRADGAEGCDGRVATC